MTDSAADVADSPVRKSKLPLILGICLAVMGGGGGFYAVSSGLVPVGESGTKTEKSTDSASFSDIAYVAVTPLVVSLNAKGKVQHLRFHAQLEVSKYHKSEVEKVLPRVTDVLNSYLRALKLEDVESPLALTRIRAQMLRRIQIVTGEGRVQDLLVMEFVLS